MIVLDVMTSRPAVADVSSTIRSVMHKLFELDVRHLPIVEDGELVGIVSDRDLRAVVSRLLSEGEANIDDALSAPVGDLMSAAVISVDPEAELADVADLMIEHRIGALPVVRPGTDALVGIVSYVDVLRAARDSL
jgi:acetoin utilization protein AcuB